ncbi:MAG: 4Fe-4S binding protein [Candidatus Omnitrophota bacterium]|nr:4Fe-4S binding protein [Candidatus Omnitrophota bacterium]
MAKRKIIRIDEDKCNGCGLCIPNCPEGAIQLVDGKARLVSDLFCDGLGACLGHCPQGAISVEEREAEEYDEKAVMANRERKITVPASHGSLAPAGCPGSRVMQFGRLARPAGETGHPAAKAAESQLRQWPVQLMLVPPHAPYFSGADLLIAADCVPFAYADFHQELLKGKILLVGCPKLDDTVVYREKISQILKVNQIKSVTYAHMEVPCCFGLVGVVREAIAASGKTVPFQEIVVSIQGERIK